MRFCSVAIVATLAALTAARAIQQNEERDTLQEDIDAVFPEVVSDIVDTSGEVTAELVTRQTAAASESSLSL